MMKQSEKIQKKNNRVKAILVLTIATALLFLFAGHTSYAVLNGSEHAFSAFPIVIERIRTIPTDCLYFEPFSWILYGCVYGVAILMALYRPVMPKAEMKGEEHGSNDFETVDETLQYLEENTTPIYALDLRDFGRR